jgi:creatinine amidohydrolase
MVLNWQELSTKEFEQLKQEGKAWVVLPISSTEQHGPHLPVGTDALILQGMLNEAMPAWTGEPPLILMPPIAYGKSIEHKEFAGTITLSAHTLLNVIEDIVASLAAHSFRRIIIINSHGGNSAMLDGFLQDLRQTYDAQVYLINLWSLGIGDYLAAKFGDSAKDQIHAGIDETSFMLYFQKHLVKTQEIKKQEQNYKPGWKHLLSLQGKASWGWATADLTTSGVLGEPEMASEALGQDLARWLSGRLISALSVITAKAASRD